MWGRNDEKKAFGTFYEAVNTIGENFMTENVRWGLDNPHPLSQMKTELVWEGKYDEYGNRRSIDIAGCAMPLQKIETIDEPASRAHVQGSLFDPIKAHHDDFRNMLIWGDNKLVMASLPKDFKGKIDLIYIDPLLMWVRI